MNHPKVLVVMPLYNAKPFLKTSIESIISQTYKDFILLIINDGSTDGSERLAESYSNRGVLLEHQRNSGPGVIMNKAIQYAVDNEIEYIARIDSDDIALPNRLEKQVALMEKYPDTAACSSNCYYVDADNERIIGTSTVPISPLLIRYEINNGLRGLIQGSTIFRTEPLKKIGGYREKFKLAEETDVFLRLNELYESRNSSEFLMKIRFHKNSLSVENSKNNTQYLFYALDCAKRRRGKKPEVEFDQFAENLSLKVKFSIWHEGLLLGIWRRYLNSGNPIYLILTGLLDLRRSLFRIMRIVLR